MTLLVAIAGLIVSAAWLSLGQSDEAPGPAAFARDQSAAALDGGEEVLVGEIAADDGNESLTAAADDDTVTAEDGDERLRELLVGSWEQYNYGRRVLTMHEDGTAAMDVWPEGIWAYTIASRLQIDVEWKIEEGRAIFHSVRGTPETGFRFVTQLWGDRFNRPIVELTETRFVLLKEEDGSHTEWTRLTE